MRCMHMIKKNLMNIFRSWKAILLLFVGPLTILLLLIAAFSATGFRNVDIGYTGDAQQKIIDDASYLGTFKRYASMDHCTYALTRQNLEACMEFTEITEDNLHLRLVYDNSREIISALMIDHLKRAILSEEDIRVLSETQSFFDDVGEVGLFLVQSQSNIANIITDLRYQQKELNDLRDQVRNSRRNFEEQIEGAGSNIDTAQAKHNRAEQRIVDPVDDAIDQVNKALDDMHQLKAQAQEFGDENIVAEIEAQIEQLEDTRQELLLARNDARDEVRSVGEDIEGMQDSVNEMKSSLHSFNSIDRQLAGAQQSIDAKIDSLQEMQGKLGAQAGSTSEITSRDRESLINPFQVIVDPLYQGSELAKAVGGDSTYLNFGSIQLLFPIIICMIVAFISVIFATIVGLDELHSPAYFRSLILPVHDFYMTLSLWFTAFMVSSVQTLFVLAIGNVLFLLDIFMNLFTVVGTSLLLVAIFSLCGMIIAYLVRTETTALLVSTFFLIMNFILAGIITPIERMTTFMSWLSPKLPFTMGLSMLQQSVFYNIGLFDMAPQALLLMLYVAVLIGVLFAVRTYCRRKLTEI